MADFFSSSVSSTGLPSRLAAALAYSGWWVSGLLFWWVESRDTFVRFHAIQSALAFGTIGLLVAAFAGLALLSITLFPAALTMFMWAAGITWAGGVLLWLITLFQAALGRRWHVPLFGELAERLANRAT